MFDEKNLDDITALTPMQEGMLFHYLKDTSSDLYVEQLCLEVSGTLVEEYFERAWQAVAQTNEMLRTVFRWSEVKQPLQVVLKHSHVHIIKYLDREYTEAEVDEIRRMDRCKGFDLQKVPFRVTICKLNKDAYKIIISNHHILYDGWSNGIILKEFFTLYNGLFHGQNIQLPAKTKYKTFVQWKLSQAAGEHENYWKMYLEGFDTPTELSIKIPSTNEIRTRHQETYGLPFPQEMNEMIAKFSREHQVTPAALLYCAWGLILQHYANSEDVVFGSTVSGRNAKVEGIENMVGLFINTLPLRVSPGMGKHMPDFLKAIDQTLKERESHEFMSLVDIKACSELDSQAEFFDSLVIIENYPLDASLKETGSGLTTLSYEMQEQTHYDLTLIIKLFDTIEIDMLYDRACLEKEAVANLSRHFITLLHNLVSDGNKCIDDLDILTEEEKQQILYNFNRTETPYNADKTIHGLFAEQVAKTPDYIAVVGADLRVCPRPVMQVSLTYRQLNEQADHLAQYLLEKGVSTDTIVGVMVKRTAELMIGLMGVLKAGGAYLPIDPDYPQERIDYMLKDSGAKFLLNKSEARNPKFETNPNVQNSNVQNKNLYTGDILDLNFVHLNFEFVSNFEFRISNFNSSNLAYVIYTSGSTGKPKGVMIEHQAVHNFFIGVREKIDFLAGQTILALTTVSFDIFVLETLLPLTTGLRIIMANEEQQRDAKLLNDLITRCCVDLLQMTPSRLQLLLESNAGLQGLKNIKQLMVGGEPFPIKILAELNRFFSGTPAKIYNMYGPTETTVWSCIKDLTGCPPVNIGNPIANTQVFILDKFTRPQPVGVAGELYIGGDGVARGYLNRVQLTADRFCLRQPGAFFEKTAPGPRKNFYLNPSPLNTHHSPIYRTGDLARWLPDGNIQCLGRTDNQVKVRGFRVELGEIEKRLLEHEEIKEAVVIVREDRQGDKYLCAYMVTPVQLEIAKLKEFLSGKLPGHMIPSYFMHIENIPLTPNGKVNRGALPPPEVTAGGQYSPPRDEVEETLVKLWSDILAIKTGLIGIDDHFFHLGGHSLKVTRLVSRIHKVFNVDVPIAEIFKKPFIREMAGYIKNADSSNKKNFRAITPVEKKKYYPLSSAQQRLFILSQVEGISTTYNMPGAMIIQGNLNKDHFTQSFKHLIQRHESFRTSFHLMEEGPVQVIHNDIEFTFLYLDVVTNIGANEYANMPQIEKENMIRDFIAPFDLSRAPLMRIKLIKIEALKHLLLFDMHHIISDGLSLGILTAEFRDLYLAKPLPPLEIQYKDYTLWQHRFFETGAMKNQENHWKKNFEGKIPVLEMPMDFKRPGRMGFEGNTLVFTIAAERSVQLNTLARQNHVTLNILLFSIYALLISKYGNQKEVIIGLLAAGRKHADLETIIGMFVNFLPILCRLEPGHTFIESLNATRMTILEAYENQDYPFEKIVEKLGVTSDRSRNPLFDTVFVFHEALLESSLNAGMTGLTFSRHPLADPTSAVDFKIDVFPGGAGELTCYLQYNIGLFKEESIKRLIFHFNNLIDILLAEPGKKLADISLFNPAEDRQLRVKRQLNTADPGPFHPISLAVSATFTIDPISDYTRWWGRQFKWDIQVEFAPYNQVFQQLLDRTSLLSTNKGINLVLVRFEDWIRDNNKPDEEKIRIIGEHFEQLVEILSHKQTGAPYLVGIFPTAAHLALGETVTTYLQELTQRWEKKLAAMDNVYAVDFTGLQELYLIPGVFDPATDREGHLPFTQEYYAAMGVYIARKISALKHPPYKVIALDCDNTLWRGICGEDGPTGVKVEQPYLELQKFMLQKYHEGMLLVLSSKNNEADVWEVFEKNPGMLLKKEHFVDWRIDWNPKSANLRQLAAQLNLGIDSFVFVDDSSVECLEVESNCPEVFTLHLPANPLEIPAFLSHIWAFDRLKVTDEDKNRSIMYLAEQKRQEIKKQVTTLDEFLENLDLKVNLRPIETKDISRASQLTQRTNQFNLSTLRRTEAEISQLLPEPSTACWVVEVADRFGDYGLTGVIIAREEKQEQRLFLDTFLLSCRVLGRKVEHILFTKLKQYCEEKGISIIMARFYPTAKNKPILEFLKKYPVEKIEETNHYVDYYLPVAKMTAGRTSDSLPQIEDEERGTGAKASINHMEKASLAALENAALLHQQFLYAAQQNTVEKLMQLPVYNLNQGITMPREKEYVAPRGETERKLHALWEKILNIKNPGIHDNFFELGGNSLKAVMLNEQIKQEFNLNFSSVLVYENRTIAAQMRFVEGKMKKTEILLDDEDLLLIKNRAKNNRSKQRIKRGVLAHD